MSTRRPRILMLMTQLGYGGAETCFIRLANALAQRMDVTVALFTADYGGKDYAAGHEALHPRTLLLDTPEVTGRLKRWWRRWRRVRKLKREHDICISFLSGPNMVNVLAGAQGAVISLRGSRIYDPVAPAWQRRIFRYLIDPVILTRAWRVVPVSEGLKEEVRRIAGRHAAAKVRTIPPFVLPDRIEAHLQAPVPEGWEGLKDQPVIVAVGRHSVEKGFQHLIPVFGMLARKHPGVKLILVGDGPMTAALKAQCETQKIATGDPTPGVSAVLFAGHRRNPFPFLKLGTVYALPSATEGLPNVVLEALAANLVVVAADTPWGARAVLSGHPGVPDPYPTHTPTPTDYGILMPRIDDPAYHGVWCGMLHETLVDSAWQERYAVWGPKRLEAFTMAQVVPQWERLIHEYETNA